MKTLEETLDELNFEKIFIFADRTLLECRTCGSVVNEPLRHYRWHEANK